MTYHALQGLKSLALEKKIEHSNFWSRAKAHRQELCTKSCRYVKRTKFALFKPCRMLGAARYRATALDFCDGPRDQFLQDVYVQVCETFEVQACLAHLVLSELGK